MTHTQNKGYGPDSNIYLVLLLVERRVAFGSDFLLIICVLCDDRDDDVPPWSAPCGVPRVHMQMYACMHCDGRTPLESCQNRGGNMHACSSLLTYSSSSWPVRRARVTRVWLFQVVGLETVFFLFSIWCIYTYILRQVVYIELGWIIGDKWARCMHVWFLAIIVIISYTCLRLRSVWNIYHVS